jgi:dihydroflavonol-4-reductase
MVRRESDTSRIDQLGLEKRAADLRDREALASVVAGVRSIIHTAALVDFRGDRLTQFTGLNTIAALDLFRAASEAGVRRFLHISTVAAVGALLRGARDEAEKSRPITEKHEFNLSGLRVPYIMTKRAAEEELRQLSGQSATELVTVNPSIMIAPSGEGEKQAGFRCRVRSAWLPKVINAVNLVDIRDVAAATITALVQGNAGDRYILAGENVTLTEILKMTSIYTGKSPVLIPVPRVLMNVVARWSELWYRLRGRSRLSLYPDLVRLLDYDWVYASEKARAELGFSPRPLADTIRDALT